MNNTNAYTGIRISSTDIKLSKQFCETFVKKNKFVTLSWDDKKEELEMIFYPTDSDVAFRYQIFSPDSSSNIHRIRCTKFWRKYLHKYKSKRYKVTDIDMTKAGIPMVKFKLESIS